MIRYNWSLELRESRGSIPKDCSPIEKKYYKPHQRIPELLLKHNYLYHVRCRNSCVGIYNYERRSFTIPRSGYSGNYLFEEYDWNIGRPHGTVVPFNMIEKAPSFINDHHKLFIYWIGEINLAIQIQNGKTIITVNLKIFV